MHMVVGFLLASLIKQKSGIRTGLPSIRGKLEAVHALPGRMRLGSPLLEGLPANTRRKIGTEIKKNRRYRRGGHQCAFRKHADPV